MGRGANRDKRATPVFSGTSNGAVACKSGKIQKIVRGWWGGGNALRLEKPAGAPQANQGWRKA